MPSLILSTCGTSLLTNGGISDDLRRLLNKHANSRDWSVMPADESHTLQQHANNRQQSLLAADEQQVRRLSAELNGLLSWQKQPSTPASTQDMYLLLATDTALGQATAQSVCAWLQQQGCSATIISATGLNTASLSSFRQALSGLVKDLHEQLSNYKTSGYSINFNLTGGFKGLNGFLQALATIYADNAFYLFEGSSELMLIPSLPLTLDAEQVIKQNLRAMRRLSHNLSISASECAAIPELLLFSIDQERILSEWGELLWRNSQAKIYKQGLLPSISERIIFGDAFEVSTKNKNPELISIINQRIDDLAVYAESDCKLALKSLDPKQLQGSQHKSLWECDLDDHHRIFMRKDGHNFYLEKVDKALH
ncbi:MAG TPA: putative CRISPR-associated protein [Agitococcus sp.]|nr:putative CRISPR-associated protein [Agitococcus sp.]HNB19912.1 putative CRISPR-associated protein [Agitococcus sp.]HNI63880.1 putative CRISPR-associated protein [Agitococcus sp.]HNJ87165.1 putative CRISPR-associated protein [Agitococcus sp.]HNP02785.1 putative CRISPR-associated protein [Agitococcus sp.]